MQKSVKEKLSALKKIVAGTPPIEVLAPPGYGSVVFQFDDCYEIDGIKYTQEEYDIWLGRNKQTHLIVFQEFRKNS